MRKSVKVMIEKAEAVCILCDKTSPEGIPPYQNELDHVIEELKAAIAKVKDGA